MTKSNGYNIRVIERTIGVLNLLSKKMPQNLTQISSELEMNRSTVFRILKTLESYNFVALDKKSKEYRLGLRCLELAGDYYDKDDLRKIAIDDLTWLRDKTGESVHLGILDKMEVLYIEKLQGLHAIGLMASALGRRSPTYCTGLGKVLIAYEDHNEVRSYFSQCGMKRFTPSTIRSVDELIGQLKIIKKNGYALDLEEHEPEVYCVATPIKNSEGKVVAAISISGPKSRMGNIKGNQELVDIAICAAQRISKKLEGQISFGSFG